MGVDACGVVVHGGDAHGVLHAMGDGVQGIFYSCNTGTFLIYLYKAYSVHRPSAGTSFEFHYLGMHIHLCTMPISFFSFLALWLNSHMHIKCTCVLSVDGPNIGLYAKEHCGSLLYSIPHHGFSLGS